MSVAVDNSLIKQLHTYRLTTAEIIYRIPDHPSLLQSFVWQELDIAPKFPILHRFLDFWQRNLDGKVFLVKVSHIDHISAGEYKNHDNEIILH